LGEGSDGDGWLRGPGITAADDEDEAIFKKALAKDFTA
jgi:hypothetical protein